MDLDNLLDNSCETSWSICIHNGVHANNVLRHVVNHTLALIPLLQHFTGHSNVIRNFLVLFGTNIS